MSGYFQRLMNRGAGVDALIHPLSRLPYAAVPESEPFADSGELATAQRAWEEPQGAGRAKDSAAVPAPAPDHEVLAASLRPPAPEISPLLTRTFELKEGVTSLRRKVPTMSVAQAAEEPTAVSQQLPLERGEEHPVNGAFEPFHLLMPRTLANVVAPFGSPQSWAGCVQATHPGLKDHVSAHAQKNQPGMSAEPEVHVSIGRIEVTAVTAAPAQRRAAIPRKPTMSLDAYLARRQRREP
jgi:hypothetical protein